MCIRDRLHPDQGMAFHEIQNQLEGDHVEHAAGAAQTQHDLLALQLPQPVLDLLQLAHDPLRLLIQEICTLRGFQPLFRPLKELGAKFIFQEADILAQPLGRDVEFAGGLVDAALLVHGLKTFQVLCIHESLPNLLHFPRSRAFAGAVSIYCTLKMNRRPVFWSFLASLFRSRRQAA